MHGKRARCLSTTPETPQQPQSLYTDTSRERVATVFADTIEAFGYEF